MVASAATGTALNAVSARNGSSQNMVAAIANIVTRLVAAPARPFCRKRARESTSNGHAGKTRIGMLFMPGESKTQHMAEAAQAHRMLN